MCFSLQEGDGACRGSPETTEVLTGTVTISKLAQVRGVVNRILGKNMEMDVFADCNYYFLAMISVVVWM